MRILKRILAGLGILLLALVIVLAGSIMVDSLIGGGRVDAITNTIVPNANGPAVRAYVAKPSTPGPHPTVIMVHEFWGIKPEIIGKADALAQEGYVVIAPDLFRGSTTDLIPRAIFNVISHPAAQVDSDLDAVVKWAQAQPDVLADKVAVMGFCFGGGTAIRYSAGTNPGLAATVVFYGTPVDDANKLKTLAGPVLGIFGGDDASIPVSEVNAFEAGLKSAGVPHQITVYDGQPHAFVTSIEEIQKGGAQGAAWNEFVTFLNQTLKGDGSAIQQGLRVLPTAMHGHSHPADLLHVINHWHALIPN
jgi:carboxymethylenebutenolidase